MFECRAVFLQPGHSKPDIPQCAHHLAKWLTEGAAAYDARSALAAARPRAGEAQGVQGAVELIATVSLPEEVATLLLRELADTGAVDINELSREDWVSLPSWRMLRRMEQRRFWLALARAT